MSVAEEKLQQWTTILDQAKYLGAEFRYKEKDYGLIWRTAFKEELQYKTERLIERQRIDTEFFQRDQRFDFYFNIIVQLVTKDFDEFVHYMSEANQRGIQILENSLFDYEETIGYLRIQLKNRNLDTDMVELRQARANNGGNSQLKDLKVQSSINFTSTSGMGLQQRELVTQASAPNLNNQYMNKSVASLNNPMGSVTNLHDKSIDENDENLHIVENGDNEIHIMDEYAGEIEIKNKETISTVRTEVTNDDEICKRMSIKYTYSILDQVRKAYDSNYDRPSSSDFLPKDTINNIANINAASYSWEVIDRAINNW